MDKKIALTGEGVLYAILKDEKVGPIVNVPNQPVSSAPISVEYSALNGGDCVCFPKKPGRQPN
ncbi:hypothetical protein [Bacillus velezensis]|uniref:hypothetical protein n=1 Tax=Bacillus velezensis TaxID=492670 RepID=UPI0009F1D26A|nr:hypothetical protein [Bacillus velezensis]OQV53388.1 hypothetical protein B5Z20_03475 [Bacillus velezensis]OQV55411.1 hypothetical protein B5Z22_08340 [Bacillus velezensis]OQV60902.1 hypothetical protein B5Z24_08345 [Bacillus velezensis]OQV61969.1 hypothetical protein B5Z23_08330 [Bacillus velezensis]